MSKVLVTGGLGFIGSNLVDKLVERGDEVVVIDNLSTGKWVNHNPKAKYLIEDIRIAIDDFLKNVVFSHESDDFWRGIEVIYHLAAMPRIQPSFIDPVGSIELNMLGTAAVCELARKINAKVVYAGSSSFYGGVYKNPYTFSKWQGEEACRLYSEIFNVQTRVARFFNVYGPRHLSEGEYATVVAIFERQHQAGESLTVTGNGEQRRDFTHVNDICEGLICMGSDSLGGTATYNLGTGTNHSINELAKMFGGDVRYIPARPGEAWITLAELEETIAAYETWRPVMTLDGYVEEFKRTVKS